MAETAMTADEKKAAEERKIDAAVADRLKCQGCQKPLVPVPHRAYVQWTCPTPGCSRMLPPSTVAANQTRARAFIAAPAARRGSSNAPAPRRSASDR